ncbi:Serine/threonine kinase [hydrothermal vent metagenome]|uniref:Serine/threonine kinase n=1 Tax=hydrothermal vent metagenome TaxID=652676 RepID=A0A3B1AQ14_9ZZZZ
MSELDKRLQQNQKANWVRYLLGFIVVAMLVFGYLTWLFFTKGYEIVVSPAQAKPTAFVEVAEGSGFALGTRVYAVGGNFVIAVGAEKFQTSNIHITAASEKVIEVKLAPKPGRIIVSTLPQDENTTWNIDGKLVAVSRSLDHELRPDHYQLRIDSKFRMPIEQDIVIKPDETQHLAVTLPTFTSTLKITSKPLKANIYLDNELIGTSPLSMDKPGGSYEVKIVLDGFKILRETVELTNENLQVARHYFLEPQQGMITINVQPDGGSLLIGGEPKKPGDISIDANSTYTIRYQKPGYFGFLKKVKLKPGETKEFNINLKREYGEVSITSKPEAEVFVTGKSQGFTPLTLRLPAISQKISLKKTGYRTVTNTLIPTSKKPHVIKAVLLTEFDARQKNGKPSFAQTLGIDMRPFAPSAFTMGSPPNEQGRRRNEFQIPVSFSRNIWVSRHEITEAQFQRFDPNSKKSTLPKTSISWMQAAAFCNWLSQQEGLPKFYNIKNGRVDGYNISANGYRLLTEAEWEWLAAKAKRSKKTRFVWGDMERIPHDVGNLSDKSNKGKQPFYLADYSDSFPALAPVGSFKADRIGLFDMAGNVSEWVNDKYSNTPVDTSINHVDYQGATRGINHVFKGANYTSGRISRLRTAYRESSDTASDTIGFRVARYK